jgi:BatD DUF11 like domain
MLKFLLHIIIATSCAFICNAQQVVFMAQSSSRQVGLQSRFQVSFTVQNANQINQLKVPNFQNFVIVGGPMQSSSFSTINGSSSSSISYTYYLQPKQVGNYTIAPAIAIVDGKTIKSNEIAIQVVNGEGKSQAQKKSQQYQDPFNDPIFDDDGSLEELNAIKNKKAKNKVLSLKDISDKVFARVDVDKTTAYQGEQITASYNVYSQLPLEAGFKKLMSPDGFWSQDYTNNINPQACEKVVENGKEYRKYTLRKTALFATKSGELVIPSVEIQTAVETNAPAQNNGEEDNFLGALMNQIFNGESMERVPLDLQTAPVKLKINALPLENKPKQFSENIGQYTIEGNIDKTEITTDETSTLQLTIRGNGNIKLISNPVLSIPGDFESIEPSITDTITNSTAEMAGYKIFKYVLSPRNTGELHIPSASFSFFNPQSNTYETVTTPAYTIKVKPGKNILTHKPKGLPQDIHDIVNDDTMQRQTIKKLPENILYWGAYCLPIFALLGINISKKRKQYLENNIVNKKTKNAKYTAMQRLSIAQEMLKDNNRNGFYNETSKAIWLYLSDKLSIPLSKLNKTDVLEILHQEGVSATTKNELQNILQQCETELYAVSYNDNMQQTYDDTLQILSHLENHFSAF